MSRSSDRGFLAREERRLDRIRERTSQLSRDPLNEDIIPSSASKMNLGFVTKTVASDWPKFYGRTVYFAAVFLVARSLVWFFSTPQVFLGALIVALVWSTARMAAHLKASDVVASAVRAVAPLVLFVLLFAPTAIAFSLVFAVALIHILRLSDDLVGHTAELEASRVSPAMNETRRKQVRALWKSRSLYRLFGQALSEPPRNEEQRIRRGYEVNSLFVLGLALWMLLVGATAAMVDWPQVPAVMFGLVVAVVAVLVRAWAQTRTPFYGKSSAYKSAIQSWLGYNIDEVGAPGVVQSPSGDCIDRQRALARAFPFFGVSVLLLGAFAPLVFVVLPPSSPAWVEASEFVPKTLAEKTHRITVTDLPQELIEHAHRTLGYGPKAQEFLQLHANLANAERVEAIRVQAAADMANRPEAWVVHFWHVFFKSSAKLELATIALASFLLCLFVPQILFHSILFAVTGGALARIRHWRECYPKSQEEQGETAWQSYVTRIASSTLDIERNHVLLGRNKLDDYPVLISRDKLGEHAHLLGGSGSGKTAMLASLVAQLIRDGDSVVILDLKGDRDDMSLFEQARLSAAKEHTFKWFTREHERSTFVFNPLTQPQLRGLSPADRAEMLVKPMGLSHGDDYGKGFFSSANLHALQKAFEFLQQPEDEDAQPVEPQSFRDLQRALEKPGREGALDKEEWKTASHLRYAIDQLAGIDILNVVPPPESEGADGEGAHPAKVHERAINMADVFKDPTVLYFWMPASLHEKGARDMGKFAAHALLSAPRPAPEDRKVRRVWFVVDEFQQIVSKDLELFISQARSMGIGTILANQNMGQLREVSDNMPSIITSNTDTQLVFSARDAGERDELSRGSGETIYHLVSWAQSMHESVTTAEAFGPRLTVNDLIQMSAEPRTCYVRLNSNKGYACYDGFPFMMEFDFHIDQSEYTARKKAPWPPSDPEGQGTIETKLGPYDLPSPGEVKARTQRSTKHRHKRNKNT